MKISKSSRHSKITGDFAEALVLYWLSKYGFECAKVDHTGIDLIAKNSKTKELMGISVKSRSRNVGKERDPVRIDNDNFDKAKVACKVFGCTPYFAIVIDSRNTISVFILSMREMIKLSAPGKTACRWKVTPKDIEEYKNNRNIISFEFTHQTLNWFR